AFAPFLFHLLREPRVIHPIPMCPRSSGEYITQLHRSFEVSLGPPAQYSTMRSTISVPSGHFWTAPPHPLWYKQNSKCPLPSSYLTSISARSVPSASTLGSTNDVIVAVFPFAKVIFEPNGIRRNNSCNASIACALILADVCS